MFTWTWPRYTQSVILRLYLVSVGLFASDHSNGSDDCYIAGIDDRLRCGLVKVAENPSQPNGRKIDIHYAVIPAIKTIHRHEALLAIAGGPGQSAIDNGRLFHRTFSDIRQPRDLLLIDHRGTGRSNGLQCREDKTISPLIVDDRIFDIALESKQCLAQLDADVTQYTSAIALADFEAVRKQLGYHKLHLYGISYGTRMAQLYMREYPEALATVTLDGVLPMQQSALAVGLAVDRAIQLLLAECARLDDCRNQFPTLDHSLDTISAQLGRSPIKLQVVHPTSGEPTEFLLTRGKFFGVLRLALYSPNTRSLLPLAIDRAARGNYQAILGLYSLTLGGLDMSMGMHASVVCNEDLHRFSGNLIGQLKRSRIGGSMLDQISEICSVWPTNIVDENFSQPISSDMPTLLLSGQQDPATPPEWADLAMLEMTAAAHLVAPYASHGVAMQTCANSLIADFVDTRSTAGLKSECLEEGGAGGFYLNANSIDIVSATVPKGQLRNNAEGAL